MTSALEAVRLSGLVPTIQVDRAEDVVPTCAALSAGGIDVVEITLRTPASMAAVALATREFPDLTVGVGTVRRPEQADEARRRGAAFLVTPGCNPRVLQYCRSAGLPLIPGCGSGGEIEACLDYGFDIVKIFPVEQLGGLRLLRAFAGPYPEVRFVPMGGVNPANIGQYIANKKVFACGGSWIAPPALIASGEFAAIEHNAKGAVLAMLGLELARMPRAGEPLPLRCRSLERLNHYLSKPGAGIDPGIQVLDVSGEEW